MSIGQLQQRIKIYRQNLTDASGPEDVGAHLGLTEACSIGWESTVEGK